MKIRQGDIYLVNFGKKYNSELGKIRPAVVVQNDFFNMAVKDHIYKQVLVVPLSTKEIEDDYRMACSARDNLKKDSFIIANWLCTIDIEHILVERGLIARLNEDEFGVLKEKICNLL